MYLYTTTEDIPIFNFDKILTTNNYAYLVEGWDYRKEIIVPETASKNWNEIYNEYCSKTENNEALIYYALVTELDYLETRFNIVVTLIESLSDHNKESFGRELNAWGFMFNIHGKIEDQIEALQRQLRAAKQKIDIRRNRLETMQTDEAPTSLIKQNIKLKRITGLDIDTKKTTVDEWIELHKEAKEIVQQKNSRNG